MTKEMVVKENKEYTIGEFDCPNCGERHLLKCRTKKDNPTMRKRTEHWIE